MKTKLFIVTSVAALCFSSCTVWNKLESALLHVDPLGKSTVESFLGTLEGYQAAGEGLHYRLLQLYDKDFVRYGEIMGDLLQITTDANEGDYLAFNYQLEAEHVATYPRNLWTAGWAVMTEANNLLYYGPRLKEQCSSDAQKAIVDRAMAYAYFGRALGHWALCICYGQPYNYTNEHDHLGIPIVNIIPKYTDLFDRKPVEKVYEQVIRDLEESMTIFKEIAEYNTTDGPKYAQIDKITDCYHASYIACEALLARIYLFMEDWDKAISYSESVMKKVGLSPREEYVDMFRESQDHPGKEAIFRLNSYDKTTSTGNLFDPTRSPSFLPIPSMESRFSASDIRKDLLTYIGEPTEDPVYAGKSFPAVCKFLYRKSISTEEKRCHDIFVLRCSEMYLIHAEASAQNNDITSALNDLKEIIGRATGVAASSVSISASSKEQALSLVAEERVKELCFEGHRFFDITRRKENLVRSASSGAQGDALKVTYPNNRFVLPIDRMELQSNPNMKQNPGYQEYSAQ